jgi:hypothetical protein
MRLRKPLRKLAMASPLAGFQLACVGALGEQAVLSHYVEKYWVADLSAFRDAVGLGGAITRDDLDAIIREDARTVTADILAWAADNREPIGVLASMLRGSRPAYGPRHVPRDDWILSEDEVMRFLG